MSVIDTILNNKYLLRDILQTYAGQLKELKELHAINCPECEAKDKPCKKYYWLCLDLHEVEFLVKELEKEVVHLPR